MIQPRPAQPSRVLLALMFCLALLAPGGAVRSAAGPDAATSLAAAAPAGLEQGLLGGRPGGSLVASGGKRDDRPRPGPGLVGLLVGAVTAAATWTVLAGRRAQPRGGRRRAAAAGPRAPPSFQPAPI
jgi:hypothetical protein